MNVLFVCAGNVARSVMAEALLKSMDSIHSVQSAGLNPNIGTSPHKNTMTILITHSLTSFIKNKTSQTVTLELLDWADTVFTMEQEQVEFIKKNFPRGVKFRGIPDICLINTIILGDKDISDPTDAGSLEDCTKVFIEIKKGIKEFVEPPNLPRFPQ